MDIGEANRLAWDRAVEDGENPYTQVVTPEQVAAARSGEWSVYLSDRTPVPREWFPPLPGAAVLCLASGGGQQAPIFAAAGAEVTVVDASARQLDQDRFVADRDGLTIRCIQGDIANLSGLDEGSFDLVANPVSTLFVPDLRPVFRECHRVLRPGGTFLTAFMNPDEFVFDADALDHDGTFVVRHPLPYVEHETLTAEQLDARRRDQEMFHFSHTMQAQLGGICDVGFVITRFFEDRRPEQDGNPIRHYLPSYFVVAAQKG